jgi:hypothetical protein
MQDVGWPEPAAVVAIIESTLRRRAFSLIASTTEVDGAATEATLIKSSFPMGQSYSFSGAGGERLPIFNLRATFYMRRRTTFPEGKSA